MRDPFPIVDVLSAGHIRDASRRVTEEARMHVRDGGQPFRPQQAQERGPVLACLPLADIQTEPAPLASE